MPRIDRTRLEHAIFPSVADIQTRFADLDTLGHINNVAAAAILQEGRVHFNRTMGIVETLVDLRALVAALSIEYVHEMHNLAAINVQTGVIAIGQKSVAIGQLARQDGRIVLFAETVLVMANANGPVLISDPVRADYAAALIQPKSWAI